LNDLLARAEYPSGRFGFAAGQVPMALGVNDMGLNRRVSFSFRHFFLYLFLLFSLNVSLPAVAQSPVAHPAKKVLLVHSYEREDPWVAEVTSGVAEAFAEQNVDLEIFYMDSRRQTSPQWKEAAGERARQKIDTWHPEVVIAVDDIAQIYVVQKYVGKKTPFFVFCGVTADPGDYGFPASNVTGIVERPQVEQSLAWLREIVGKVGRVAMLSDEDPSSVNLERFMSGEEYSVKILGYHLISEFDVWQERVKKYNVDADAMFIYRYHAVYGQDEKVNMASKDVLQWTIENSREPLVGFFDFAVEAGMLCGVVIPGQERGLQAGKMAVALLRGTDIRELPIKIADQGVRMINLRTAARLGITVSEKTLQAAGRIFQ